MQTQPALSAVPAAPAAAPVAAAPAPGFMASNNGLRLQGGLGVLGLSALLYGSFWLYRKIRGLPQPKA